MYFPSNRFSFRLFETNCDEYTRQTTRRFLNFLTSLPTSDSYLNSSLKYGAEEYFLKLKLLLLQHAPYPVMLLELLEYSVEFLRSIVHRFFVAPLAFFRLGVSNMHLLDYNGTRFSQEYLPVALCLLSLLLSLLFFALKMKTTKKNSSNKSATTVTGIVVPRRSDIHRTLSSFIVPTPIGRSRFPLDFLRVPTRHDGSKAIIELDVSILLAGLLSGKLELRLRDVTRTDGAASASASASTLSTLESFRCPDNSEFSLLSLLQGTLSLNGYQVKLNVGTRFTMRVVGWVFLNGYAQAGYASSASVLGGAAGVSSPGSLGVAPALLDLDHIPYASIEAQLQSFVHSLPVGTIGTVEFSVLAPQIKLLSDSTTWTLCAVPFMCSDICIDSGNQSQSNSTLAPTPMLLSLKRVVEILSTITITTTTPSNSTPTSLLNAKANTNANLDSIPTSEAPLQILSCTNTSAEYTSALGARALGFARKGSSIESESETAARTPATSSGMLQWHAAVIKAGWVQRWVVAVRR